MASGGQSKKAEAARLYLKKFREKPSAYLYTLKDRDQKINQFKELKWFLPKNFFRSLSWFFITCWRYLFNEQFRGHADEQPLTYLIDRLRRKARSLIGFNYFYEPIGPEEDYAFFPLHFEPEVATLLYAPFWTEQLNLIRQIAMSLPLHFKLYVKEHPAMVGYRTHRYYRELKKIPNVKLINPAGDSFDLIKNSKLITTITGTSGWEGIIFKKPVITFGDVFFNALSAVKRCREIEQLPFLVKEQLENFHHHEEELENFIGAILEESAPVDLLKIWEQNETPAVEQKKLTLLADLMAKKLNLKATDI